MYATAQQYAITFRGCTASGAGWWGFGGQLRFGAVGQIRQMKCEPAAVSYSWCDLSCGD